MKEFWINVYSDGKHGAPYYSRINAIFASAQMAQTYGMQTLYRIHVRAK